MGARRADTVLVVLNTVMAVALAVALSALAFSGQLPFVEELFYGHAVSPAPEAAIPDDATGVGYPEVHRGENRAWTRRPPGPYPTEPARLADADTLVEDLLNRPELIPYEGVLGGTMGFYTEDNIRVLDNHWIYAHFEDGHIGGAMLLAYRKRADGQIEWYILDSYLDR